MIWISEGQIDYLYVKKKKKTHTEMWWRNQIDRQINWKLKR